jgi:hypothetical protein
MTNEEWWNAFSAAIIPRNLGLDGDTAYVKYPAKTGLHSFQCARDENVRIGAAVVEILLPEWRAAHPRGTAPIRAVAAARKTPSADGDLRKHVQALAKACTSSRARCIGDGHRIAEAARAVANAAAAANDNGARNAVGEALSLTEDYLVGYDGPYLIDVAASASPGLAARVAEVRRRILRRALGEVWRSRKAGWLSATALSIARAIAGNGSRREGALDDLPILADALEEAGCDNQRLLGHCRGATRAWWIVDLMLGTE